MKKISIAIPTWECNGRGVEFLDDLLRTIEIQKFKDFEVVISDHSENDDLVNKVKEFDTKFQIKTSPVLFGIDKAFSVNIALLGMNYLFAILSIIFFIEIRFRIFILLYHILLIGILIFVKSKQKEIIESTISLQKFYKWIWNSFYLEYLVILVAFY